MNFEKIKTYFPVFRKAKSKNGEMIHTKVVPVCLKKQNGIKKADFLRKIRFFLISYARLNIFFVLHLEKTNLSSLIWYSSDQISP